MHYTGKLQAPDAVHPIALDALHILSPLLNSCFIDVFTQHDSRPEVARENKEYYCRE